VGTVPNNRRSWFWRWAVCIGLISVLVGISGDAQDPSKSAGQTIPVSPGLAAPDNVRAPSGQAIKTASGVAMEVLKPGTGTQHPSGDDCVVISFTAWKRDGSLFSTSGAHGELTVQCLFTALPGISEALNSMVTGEKRRVWIPGAMAFARHIAHHANKVNHEEPPPNVDLTVDLELMQILKAPTPPPDLKTPPPAALRMPSGVALQVLKPGTGTAHPIMTSRVTLNYSGWTMDGKLFESTIMSGHPGDFLVGTVLLGWREVLPKMVAGEKVRIWIPAALAYGDHPVDKMVPAGSLVYDIELLAFK
jgi:FKBP-type peptidyl-prolyl cis-trans isomerase